MIFTFPTNADVLVKGSPACPTKELAQEIVDLLLAEIEVLGGIDRVLGLAAPQIGISSQVFIAKIGGKLVPYINPRVTGNARLGREVQTEACFSIPGESFPVPRALGLGIEYQDLKDWNFKFQDLRGMDARIIQHEFDHLHGRLINGHANSIPGPDGFRDPTGNLARAQVSTSWRTVATGGSVESFDPSDGFEDGEGDGSEPEQHANPSSV